MNNSMLNEIPKAFWRYYDLFRRGKIKIEDFAEQSQITIDDLKQYLSSI